MKFHLILTLDYEIFGDGSGCLQHCLLDPTRACLEVIEAHDGCLSFFADALEFASFAQQHRRHPNTPVAAAYPAVARQLAAITDSRHNLQLHLHPQWQHARFDGTGWRLDFAKWRIGDLNGADIRDCIRRGLDYLGQFAPRPGQDLLAFRAGGWAIQPGGPVIEALAAAGLCIDSTVAPGLFNLAGGDGYDFRGASRAPWWPIAEDVCQPAAAGRLLEVPIATERIGRRHHWRALRQRQQQPALPVGCRGSYANPNNRGQQLIYKLNRLQSLGQAMLDFSSLPASAMIAITRGYMQRHDGHPGPVPIVAIGHNKNFTAWSARQLDQYLAWASAQPTLQLSDYGRWSRARELAAPAPPAEVLAIPC